MQTTQEKEIQQLKRALAVEAALEKVRIRTMTMHKSSELPDVALVLVNQLAALNINQLGSSILIVDETAATYSQYAAHDDLKSQRKVLKIIEDKDVTTIFLGREILRLTKSGEKEFSFPLKGRNLEEFIQDLIDHEVHKERGEAMRKANFECVYFYFAVYHGLSPIVITTLESLPKSDQAILKRMATTFGMSYRRFLDLQKAEAQAREAQIETALERVRSTSIAMHNSSQLRSVIDEVFIQLQKLGFDIRVCSLNFLDRVTKNITSWVSAGDDNYTKSIETPYVKSVFLDRIIEAFIAGEGFLTESFSKKVIQRYHNKVFKFPALKTMPEEHKQAILNASGYYRASALGSYGILQMIDLTGKPFPQEQNHILARFSKVFEQAYTRVLDLQKAEAQAREAQIEAALERVRAASMAMHKSEDLPSVALVLFNQVEQLNIKLLGAGFNIVEEESKTFTQYLVYEDSINNERQIKAIPGFDINALYITKESYRQLKSGVKNYSIQLSGKHLQAWIADVKLKVDTQRGTALEAANLKSIYFNGIKFHGLSNITLTSLLPLSEADQSILRRMGNTFGLSYQRFLDLQKAEAQAREAQIEAALERVRARTMWMQKSHELREVVSVMYEEMESLGLAKWGCQIMLCHKDKEVFEFWLVEETDSNQKSNYFVKGKEHPIYRKIWRSWKNQTNAFTLHHRDEYKLAFDKYWIEETDFKHLPDEVKASVYDRNEVFLNYAPMKHGLLNAISFEKPSDKLLVILARFAKVFEQTYTRFLDLQKAEAQAREAQIEAALERVRTASMAMHKSSELTEVTGVLVKEFRNLGVDSFGNWIAFIDVEANIIETWSTTGEQSWSALKVNGSDYTIYQEIIDAFKNKEALIQHTLERETAILWYKRQFGLDVIAPNDATNFYLFNMRHEFGFLGYSSWQKNEEETSLILMRFCRVFEQTYTRFLDIQKAEKQAQEIEKVFKENQRLLHSILPKPIAEQIRQGQQTVVKRFEQVSILFADIVGFTILSERLSPQEVVDILNGLFSQFDDLTDKYGLEKIKTIGDAYMVAAGVPEEKDNHAQLMFSFAKDMLHTLQGYNKIIGTDLKIRIGISSGPVVAGVIGKKKFAYDLWGDTVNTAARMEAYGQADCIQLAPSTYEILKDRYVFEQIPNVAIKGKGTMDVYLWKK